MLEKCTCPKFSCHEIPAIKMHAVMVVRLIPHTVLHSVAFPTISFMAVSEVMGRVCVCMCLPFRMSNLSWLTIQGGYQRSIFQARA